MELREVYVLLGTFLLATSNNAADIQAELDIEGDDNEILQMVFKKLEMLGNRTNSNGSTALSPSHTELASALLQVAPVVTIKGNITDPSRRYTISFAVQVSQNKDLLESDSDDDEEERERDWRGSGGLLHPLVDAVEPYVLGFAELVFHGVLSTVISNFLQSTTMMGDTLLV